MLLLLEMAVLLLALLQVVAAVDTDVMEMKNAGTASGRIAIIRKKKETAKQSLWIDNEDIDRGTRRESKEVGCVLQPLSSTCSMALW